MKHLPQYVMFIKTNSKRRKWLWNDRATIDNSRSWDFSNWNFNTNFTRFKEITRNFISINNTTFPIRLLKDDKAAAISVEFLILLPIILFMLFGGTDYYITQAQQDQVEHVKTYYLDRMKIEGTLIDEDKADIYNKLTSKGYSNIDITAKDIEGNELDSSTVLVRNIEEPDKGKLILNIQATPKFQPFMFGKILGSTVNPDFYFKVGGETLSEKAVAN